MGFNLVNLAITVRSDEAARLCYRLPLLGREYAAACRNISCRWPERQCDSCPDQGICGWHLVFGQKLASDPEALRRHQKPPLPFVFSFPMLEDIPRARNEIVCGLVVIGQAIPHIGMLLHGFADLLSDRSSPVPADILLIACRDYQGTVLSSVGEHAFFRAVSMVPENLVIASTEGLLESRVWGSSDLHIRLLSPLKILEDGRPATRFDFGRFARSVMRRVSSLTYYYGESELDCDYREMSHQADEVICTDDHFCATKAQNRQLSGITGYGSFLGDFSRLMPFFVIGSYVHAGKGASFGMGAYELRADDGR